MQTIAWVSMVGFTMNALAMDMKFCVDQNSTTPTYVVAKLVNSESDFKEANLFCNRKEDRGSLSGKNSFMAMIGKRCDTGLVNALEEAAENYYGIGFNVSIDSKGWPIISGYALLKNVDCRSGNPEPVKL